MKVARPFALLSALILATAPASAQNLVTNPGFDGDLSGWSTGAATFDGTLDDTGTAGSGSARHMFINAGPGSVTSLALSQCIPVTAGTDYTFGGKVFIASGQAVPVTGFVTVTFMSSIDCTLGGLDSAVLSTGLTDGWIPLSSGPVTASPGAIRAWITGQNAAGAAGTSAVNWDDFFLMEATGVPALPSAATTALLAALLAAAGWFALRRTTSGAA